MDDEVGVVAGGKGGADDRGSNGEDIIRHGFDCTKHIMADVVGAGTHLFRVARQRCEWDIVMGSEIGKTMRGGEAHAVPGFLQPQGKGHKRLHIAA